jgi:hypothetical protein
MVRDFVREIIIDTVEEANERSRISIPFLLGFKYR